MSNQTSVSFRDATAADVDAVLAFWREAEGVTATTTDTPEYLAALVREHPGGLILAVDGDRLVGTIICGFDGWRANLYRLAVAPAYRGQGVARLIVKEAERRLIARGARRIHAMIESDHPLAVGFWDASDYEAVPRMVPYMASLKPDDEGP